VILAEYHCTKCGRRMKAPSESGMGPVCHRAAFGSRQRKQASQPVRRDTRTPDMFGEARA